MSNPEAFDDFDFITYFDADGHPTRDAKAAVRGTITDEEGNVRREWSLLDAEGRLAPPPEAALRTVVDRDVDGRLEDVSLDVDEADE
jgi:hypothetical protein